MSPAASLACTQVYPAITGFYTLIAYISFRFFDFGGVEMIAVWHDGLKVIIIENEVIITTYQFN